MKKTCALFFLPILFSTIAFAQSGFAVNQKVEVESKGKWYKATVLAVNGNAYKIHYDGYSTSYDETVTAKRIRSMAKKSADNKTAVVSTTRYGKYGCTASKYSRGSYEYLPKGSFIISKNGNYSYLGFEKPSTGTFAADAATGVLTFKGGYFDGGEATPIEGSENRFYLVFPANPDNRWTCGLIEEKK